MPPASQNPSPITPPEPARENNEPVSAFVLPDIHPATAPQPVQSAAVPPATDSLSAASPHSQPNEIEDFEDANGVDQDDDQILLSWQNLPTPGDNHHPTAWYVILGLIFASAIIVAILTQAWFFIPLGILVPIALSIYAGKGVEQHQYNLHTHAIQVDQKFYSYDSFRAFYTVPDNTNYIVEVVPIQRFGTLISLHVPADQIDDVTDILASVMPETQPEGNLGETIFKRLKL